MLKLNSLLIILFTFCLTSYGAKSSECNDFCCQSSGSSKFCELVRKARINSDKNDILNDDVDLNDDICLSCLRADELTVMSKDNDPDKSTTIDLQQTLRKIDCKLQGKCKPKQSKRKRGILIGDSKCTWGPNVVCSSVETASECNLLSYCAEKWMHQRLNCASPHNDQCLTCQNFLSSIHFKGTPLKTIESFVNNPGEKHAYLSHLTEIIVLRNLSNGGVSPAVLCNLLKQCQGNLVSYKHDDLECVLCHSIWIRARRLLLKNKNRKFIEIRDQLLTECNNEYRCEQAVLHYLPTMMSKYIDYISNDHDIDYTAEEPCVYMRACSPSSSNPVWCDTCLTIVFYTKKILVNNASVEVARKSMKLICNLLGPRKPECEEYVDKHVEQWLDNVEVNINASKICSDLKLCSESQVNVFEQSTSELGNACEKCEALIDKIRRRATCRAKKFFDFTIPAFCRFLGPLQDRCLMTAFQIKDSIVMMIESTLRSDIICKHVCKKDDKLTVQFAKEQLLNNLVNHVCGIKSEHSADNETCQNDIKQFLSTIVEWLLTDNVIGVADDCQEVKESLSNCDICQLFEPEDIGMIMWNNDGDIDKAIKEMKRICPSAVTEPDKHQQCIKFIEEFTPMIKLALPELKKTNQFDELCNQINACEKYEDNCMICAILTHHLENLWPLDDINENSVREALNSLCHSNTTLPTNVCEKFVSNFAQTMTALIINHNSKPNNLCRNMGVCYIDPEKGKVTMSACEICRFSVEFVERALASNASEEQIIHWAEDACGRLPATYQLKCKTIVKENLHKIIELLDLLIQPEMVCNKLGLCHVSNNTTSIATQQTQQYSLCTLCQMVDIVIKGWFENNHAIEQFVAAMNTFCEKLISDKESQTDCKDAVTSIEKILNHLIKNHNSLQFCTLAQFCPSTIVSNTRAMASLLFNL